MTELSRRSSLRLLLVEDSRADVRLVREALSLHLPEAEIQVAEDGEVALKHIEHEGKFNCPDMMLLDLNLPKRNGQEVLERLREYCRDTAVIIITSSDSAKDREAVARLGANYYFRKPSNYDEFMKLGQIARELWGQRT